MPDFYDSGNGFTNDVAAGFSSNSSRIVPRPDDDNLLVPTGYDFLDVVTGGYVRGGVTIVASTSGLGKTWLGLDSVFNLLEGYHGRAVYLSNEMTSLDLSQRLLGIVNDVPVGVHDLSSYHESGELPALQAKLKEFCQRHAQWVVGDKSPLMIEDLRLYGRESTQALSEIIACIDRESCMAPVDLFVVDNLQGIDNDLIYGGASWREHLESCSMHLKTEALDHNVAILLMVQHKRPYAWGDQKKPPTLSELSLSLSPEAINAADNVFMLYLDQSQFGYDIAASLRLVITKARYCRNPAAILNKPIKVARSHGSRFKFYV